MPPTDSDLKRFTRLVRQHELEVLRFVRSHIGRVEVEDVLQSVWLEAWEQRRDVHIDLVFLLVAARRRAARHRNARRRHAWVEIDHVEAVAIGSGLDEQVQSREHAAAVRLALQRLSRRDREALHLAYVADLSHADVARVLDLPTTNAASKAISEARRRFRQIWTASER